MAPPFDSIDVVIGAIVSRLEKAETDINELHTKQRAAITQTDAIMLHTEDCRNRLRVLEAHGQSIFDSHHDVSKRVEMMESKLDDLKMNVGKVIEGQMQVVNSNLATREQFSTVLASQSKQHLERMKRLRHAIYIGGALLLIAAQWWASRTGQETLIDAVMKFVAGGGP